MHCGEGETKGLVYGGHTFLDYLLRFPFGLFAVVLLAGASRGVVGSFLRVWVQAYVEQGLDALGVLCRLHEA